MRDRCCVRLWPGVGPQCCRAATNTGAKVPLCWQHARIVQKGRPLSVFPNAVRPYYPGYYPPMPKEPTDG